jgi:Tfp pilus assembly protein PilE
MMRAPFEDKTGLMDLLPVAYIVGVVTVSVIAGGAFALYEIRANAAAVEALRVSAALHGERLRVLEANAAALENVTISLQAAQTEMARMSAIGREEIITTLRAMSARIDALKGLKR